MGEPRHAPGAEVRRGKRHRRECWKCCSEGEMSCFAGFYSDWDGDAGAVWVEETWLVLWKNNYDSFMVNRS